MQSRPYPRVARPRASRYDLCYRPDSYVTASDAAAALLAEAAGWPAPAGGGSGLGSGSGASSGVAIATLRFGRPGTIGAIDPYVIQIRAVPRGNYVSYAIVDDFGSAYRPFHAVSSEPLALGSVAELIEESEPGLLLPVLETVFGFASGRDARRETAGARSALVDAVRAFVRVESELYPGLDRYFEERIDEWLVTKGCLSVPRYGAGVPARFPASGTAREPASLLVPASCLVAGPQAEVIERVVRAWRRMAG